jgi:hypothetical protein
VRLQGIVEAAHRAGHRKARQEGTLSSWTDRVEQIRAALWAHHNRTKEVGDHLGFCYPAISPIATRMDAKRET